MRRLSAPAALLTALAAPAPAAAHGEAETAAVVVLAVLPAVGPEARLRSDDWIETRFVFAWPFQLPLGAPFGPDAEHRLVFGPELVAFSSAEDGGNEDTFLRFRAGYRHVHRERVILGLGLSADAESTLSLSPELGVRARGFTPWYVIARFERSLVEDDPLRLNLLVGFSFY